MTQELDVTALPGLTEPEAARRLQQEGYNELPTSRRRSLAGMALDVVREPMFLLLIGTGGVYLLLGDVQEALTLLSFVFLIMGITFYQERKTQRALETLRDLTSPRALVVRDGTRRRIAGREVARGDVVLLAEGDRVPADGALRWCLNLSIDESLLTGEAVPVRKLAVAAGRAAPDQETGPAAPQRPGGDDSPYVYSGTLVVKGRGVVEVLATGPRTEIGHIGRALEHVETADTPLQVEIRRLVRNLSIAGIGLCLVVAAVYGLTRGNWLQGVLAGLSLAMAMAPEEFPVVLTVFLALGAWRISRRNVLTRRVPAIETLGAASVLCVDKTGTLTQNLMAVGRLYVGGQRYDALQPVPSPLPEAFHELVEFSILASQRDPMDPMEKAVKNFGETHLADTEHLHGDWHLVREYPLSADLLALSHVWQSPDGGDYVIAVKGAPEAVADLCHLDAGAVAELAVATAAMADQGLRVLGVARASFRVARLPGQQHDFDFRMVGLIGLADPLRPTVPAAVAECTAAGIRVIMITGDYPGTAQAIARQAGLPGAGDVLIGPELDALDDDDLARRIDRVNVFARMVPEQKLRLVRALRAGGAVVAMTGDGVNDAPALKAADIGIAMGGRGTDVAREAADLVLLDDDFSSIVAAVRLGRRISDNLRKAMSYIFAIHIPIAGMALLPVLFQWPLALFPIHIVFMEMIIDPACSVVFEAEPDEANIMQRPPRPTGVALFNAGTVMVSLLQGGAVLIAVLAVFGLALRSGADDTLARALAYAALIVANIALILANRSWTQPIAATWRTPNTALWWVVGGAAVFLLLALYSPPGRSLFAFTAPPTIPLVLSLVAGAASILWFEVMKLVHRRRGAHPPI